MSGIRLLFTQLAALVLLVPLVFFGIAHDLYWGVWWFSALAHFLGGVWAGLFGAWALHLRGIRATVPMCVAIALGIGISWEIFELAIGATHLLADTADTIADLCMDMIGGLAAALALRYLWLQK